ncbi:phosphatidylethanolamine-binding protein 4 [Notolabrus celidotus]|uniref:phosphatidylethanolamine-binding protein 4 n=1 Tax=Notolabrus celidotus TaxID=1203425 RepID=UPI001490330A|nr:phosphatidylethanolamine-binding protein 4 [Notolabrus celidotus]
MAVLAPFLVLCTCVLGFHQVEATADTLCPPESSFCHGGLQVIYPGLEIDQCLVVQEGLRKKVTADWKAPKILFPGAYKAEIYVLVMVTLMPRAEKKTTSAYWRHWLVVDIQGDALQSGQLTGTTLTDYQPPSPPSRTGFHRYQFLLYEQPPDTRLSLTEEESSSRGKWDLLTFTARFNLGEPVATLVFFTKNYND